MKKAIILLMAFVLFMPVTRANSIEDDLSILISKYNDAEKKVFLDSHPVGSIYETVALDENSVERMEAKYGGEWVAYGTDKILKATTGTAGVTSGTGIANLTSSNLPAHTHTYTPTGTVTSTFTGSSATTSENDRGHTHSVAATTGTVSKNHTHTFSGTTGANSRGHTHSIPAFSGNTATTTLTGSLTMHYSEGYTDIHKVSGVISATKSNSNKYFPVGSMTGYSGATSTGEINFDATHTHSVSTTKTTSKGVSANHTHSLTTTTSGENQNHTHTFSITSGDESQTHTHDVVATGTVDSTFTGTSGTSGSTGSSSNINTLDSYITVYRYKRKK